MRDEHHEYSDTSLQSRRKPRKRLVKLPGEKRHVERSESATLIARKVVLDKLEKRARNG